MHVKWIMHVYISWFLSSMIFILGSSAIFPIIQFSFVLVQHIVPDCTCFSASAILAHFLRCEDSACILCTGFSKTIDDPPAPSVCNAPLLSFLPSYTLCCFRSQVIGIDSVHAPTPATMLHRQRQHRPLWWYACTFGVLDIIIDPFITFVYNNRCPKQWLSRQSWTCDGSYSCCTMLRYARLIMTRQTLINHRQ
jgi:hypothetical protein